MRDLIQISNALPTPFLDQELYCGVCLKVVTAPERPQIITDTTVIMGNADSDDKESCPKCGGKVGSHVIRIGLSHRGFEMF